MVGTFEKTWCSYGLCLSLYKVQCLSLPKDFDAVFSSATSGGLNLISRTPPKACARCKNKYWNSPRKRKTARTSIETTDYSTT